MLLRDLQRQIKEKLAAQDIGNPALDARLLIAHALVLTQEELLLHQDKQLSEDEVQKIDALIVQRQRRKPVAKIIGQKEFYGRVFLTNEHTLDPRPDSEILIEAVIRHAPKKNTLDILDMGTGTGCLLLTLLAEMLDTPRAIGTAVDISMRALAVAQENATRLGVNDRVVFVQSDWFENITGEFDILISNPPYIPSRDIVTLDDDVKLFDPMSALDGGEDGLDPYRLIANQAARFVKDNGLIVFEVGIGQAQDVGQIIEKQGFQPIEIANDLAGIPRVVVGLKVAKQS